ncbi:UDP-glucoronosyl and UDP-glucosyl transferase [Ancylostoma caninum]|uniref:glucuronosyltransferase n=1 Tax=Ancylostoma caninum TaxID=29170 RepID=A0A368FIB2_ANCCA|nr:UDP-glucoronosyl and UDP-glucosyl transferase [Ancylostoma caninum]
MMFVSDYLFTNNGSEVTTFGNRLPARTIRYSAPVIDDKFQKMEMKMPSLWESPSCTGVCMRWSDYDLMIEQNLDYCKWLLEDMEMIKALNESKFELVFTESLDMCAPGMFQILGIKKVVMVSAFGMYPPMYDVIGMAELPSFMPGIIMCYCLQQNVADNDISESLTPYSDKMTFLERSTNFKVNIQLKFHLRRWNHVFWEVFDAKYPGFPTIQEIFNEKTCLIMTNVNEFAETPRPTTNMVKYVGGSTLHDPKALSEDLDKVLSERSATVLFSLGSIAQSKDMPSWLKNDIIEAFASFPDVTFIWKYEGDDTSSLDAFPNIYPMKWVPQTDLLADKRLSLFITHGGMNSMLESMFHGKPVIVIPLFGDQQMNSKNVIRIGTGTVIDRNNLNKKSLKEAIQKTLFNQKIARETAFVASLLAGRPQQYRQDIAKWTKIIIEHGKMNHLLLHSRNMNLMQYYGLDILTFLASVAVSVMGPELVLNVILLQYYVSASNILIWNPLLAHSHVKFLGNIADVLTNDGHNVVCCSPLMLGLYMILGIKNMVMISAFGMLPRMYEIVGMVELPSFMPESYTPYSDDMTFLERLTNFRVYIKLMLHMRQWDSVFWEVFNAKYSGFPAIKEIYGEKTCLIMANVNEFAETPRPKTNMIRYIGGSTLYDAKPLTKVCTTEYSRSAAVVENGCAGQSLYAFKNTTRLDLDKILDERNATVLFSLGTITLSKDMPGWLKNAIVDTFALFPNVTFLWKYEDDDTTLLEGHPNIYPMKWVPQNDLLADRRLSLFITHGGMNSMLEAMFHGKPMILIPLFGDQLVNAKNVERIGTGTLIERSSLNKKTFTDAIQRTLGNRRILREAAFVASLLAGRAVQYRNDIAQWAKIIIEHGRMNHLLMHSRNLSLIQYYSLDVLAFLASLVVLIAFLLLWLFKCLFSSLRAVKPKRD